MVHEVRREDSFESWPRPFDLDLVVEFSDEEADLWFVGWGRFSEAGLDMGMLARSVVSTELECALVVRQRRGVIWFLCKDVVCCFRGLEGEDSMYPLSFRFIAVS